MKSCTTEMLHLSGYFVYMAGTEEFIKKNPEILRKCITVSTNDITCNKDTGVGSKLQCWSRGHLFIVRSCGHIDAWHPLYRYINYEVNI